MPFPKGKLFQKYDSSSSDYIYCEIIDYCYFSNTYEVMKFYDISSGIRIYDNIDEKILFNDWEEVEFINDNKFNVERNDEQFDSRHQCTCSSYDLFHYGCSCGGK